VRNLSSLLFFISFLRDPACAGMRAQAPSHRLVGGLDLHVSVASLKVLRLLPPHARSRGYCLIRMQCYMAPHCLSCQEYRDLQRQGPSCNGTATKPRRAGNLTGPRAWHAGGVTRPAHLPRKRFKGAQAVLPCPEPPARSLGPHLRWQTQCTKKAKGVGTCKHAWPLRRACHPAQQHSTAPGH